MKILSISNCPLVKSQGSGYAILNFSRGLRERGHEVDLFGPDSFEPFHSSGRAKRYRQALGMLFFTLRQLRKKRYDVVEFYGAESWLTASILHKIPNRSFLMTSHSNGIETHCTHVLKQHLHLTSIHGSLSQWYQLDQSFLLQKAFTHVDGIVTVSEYDRNYTLKHHYKDDGHVVAVEYGLPNEFLDISVNFERQPIVGYCGSWIVRKGIQVIQKDISRLLADLPNCSFQIIGVGENFKKELFFPPDICSKIKIIPFVKDKEELRKLYQSLSILIVPSIYESFGLVTAEAMACGCAVVVNGTGFAASLKHREEAFIIEKSISPLLYEGVNELLTNEPLKLKIARSGYQRVQQLRWKLAVDELERTYFNWLNELRQKNSMDVLKRVASEA